MILPQVKTARCLPPVPVPVPISMFPFVFVHVSTHGIDNAWHGFILQAAAMRQDVQGYSRKENTRWETRAKSSSRQRIRPRRRQSPRLSKRPCRKRNQTPSPSLRSSQVLIRFSPAAFDPHAAAWPLHPRKPGKQEICFFERYPGNQSWNDPAMNGFCVSVMIVNGEMRPPCDRDAIYSRFP